MKNWWKYLATFAAVLFLYGFPYFWNAFIVPICRGQVQSIEVTQWDKIISPVVTTYLSIVVIYQSQQQQKANKDSQDRLERINERMLTAEISSQLGYLLPYYKLNERCKDADSRRLYPYNLRETIELYNAGDADVFILDEVIAINEDARRKNGLSPFFISNKGPHQVLCLTPEFSETELALPQIDFNVILTLKNIKGYRYQENLFLGFERISDTTWNVNKLNMEIKGAETHAD